MILLSRYSNSELSVVNLAGIILEQLMPSEILSYDELLVCVINETSEDASNVFNYALSFLYLLGRIEYVAEIDAVKFTP